MEGLFLILGIIWLAVVSPGADFAMVSRLSCIDGRRAGLLAALGIAIGCWFHIGYAMFGIAIVERLFPQFLIVLKISGAAYLIYLGGTMALSQPASTLDTTLPSRLSGSRSLTMGLLTNGLNPKTAVFVVSLYAQVIGPGMPLAAQLGYGAVISLSHLIWFAAVATFLSRPSIRARVLARQRLANACIGTILILLGVVLGLSDIVSPGAPTTT
ncbi:threonine/homoserine/homoserine lactone efflux protein [Sphingomonas leidyi]|uniref:Threonine/homoserine/homoserine lactone efflux protein n=1 Tax=Sphingomonas leidyi TaxID=68569 RepID=A0A7X5UXT1_9SPHN|nr:LysE family transporter [Sphingomonas leidyi]NIJ64235.1 threonine/homoserine/homoserine lactone efflux protein [Sphingomonas leidyi]